MTEVEASIAVYAAGFNAHGQLLVKAEARDDGATKEGFTFNRLPGIGENASVDILLATWSSTHLFVREPTAQLQHRGWGYPDNGQWQSAPGPGLHSAFGDHNGLAGCLDANGALYVVPETAGVSGTGRRHGSLVCQSTDCSPPVAFIAMAGNGRLALTFKQAPNARLTHIAEFEDLAACLRYYRDPSIQGNYPQQHHMVAGRPRQLLANTATFTLLVESGEVYTWGDPRYQSLARQTIGEGSTAASSPGLVEALAGMKMRKIASGGWLGAALSEDGAAYMWGSGTPGTDDRLSLLKDVDPGDVVLVDLPTRGAADPPDVLDLSVGDNHIAVVADGGWLFVAGDNSNGQLGLEWTESFVPDWRETMNGIAVSRVTCGPKATFAFANLSMGGATSKVR